MGVTHPEITAGSSCVQDLVTELHMQSIFTDVGKQSLQDPSSCAVLPSFVGQMGSPITSTAWLSQSGEAHYALASSAGGIVIVTLPPHGAQGGEPLADAAVSFTGSWLLLLCSFLCFRWGVDPGAQKELHDAEAVWMDAHSHPGGAQSL